MKSTVFCCLLLSCYNAVTGKYKGLTAAHARGNEKYLSEKVDSIMVRVPKGQKAAIKAAAEKKGMSLNQYCADAIRDALRADSDIHDT